MPETKELPAWLKKLTDLGPDKLKELGFGDDDLKAANDGWLRQEDYTTKTQAVAKLKAFQDKYPNVDVEAAVDALKKWNTWGQEKWPQVQKDLDDYAKLKAEQTARPAASTNGGAGGDWSF